MKTKSAFAFRDFDKEKVLQRPFFRKFHFDADKSDDTNLQELSSLNVTSLDIMNQNLDSLSALIYHTGDYLKFIARHAKRLERYQQAVADKIFKDENADIITLRAKYVKAQEIYYAYSVASGEIQKFLREKLGRIFRPLENKFQDARRNIFAVRLRQARKAAGLTQEEIARKLRMSQTGFAKYEKNENEPPISRLIQLSQVLDCPIDWLIGATA